MKTIIGFVAVIGLLIGFAAPSFAAEAKCPALIKQFDEKLPTVKISKKQIKQANALRTKGEKASKAGKDKTCVKNMKSAINKLGK